MVVIRLARGGRKKFPFYSIVVADKKSPRNGKFIEKIGHYASTGTDTGCKISQDRYDHWISQGAQPSDRVRSLYNHSKHDKKDA